MSNIQLQNRIKIEINVFDGNLFDKSFMRD